MQCHEVDYQIIGRDIQAVEVELDPGETVIAEAGAMNWMEDGIRFETKMGDGSDADQGLLGKFMSAGKTLPLNSLSIGTIALNGSAQIIPVSLTKVGAFSVTNI